MLHLLNYLCCCAGLVCTSCIFLHLSLGNRISSFVIEIYSYCKTRGWLYCNFKIFQFRLLQSQRYHHIFCNRLKLNLCSCFFLFGKRVLFKLIFVCLLFLYETLLFASGARTFNMGEKDSIYFRQIQSTKLLHICITKLLHISSVRS